MAIIGILPALKNKNFAIYAGASNFCYVATWLQRTASGWLIWEMTQSTLWVGMFAFANLIPVVVISPIGGVLADRVSNMLVLKTAQIAMATIALVMALLTLTGEISPHLLVIIALIQGVVEAFSQTSQFSVVPVVAQGKNIASSIAVTSVSFNSSRFIGPALAGILLVTQGVPHTFAVAAVGYVVFFIGLIVVGRRIAEQPKLPAPPFLQALGEGLQYTFRSRLIGSLIVIMVLVGIVGRQTLELLPGVAEGIYREGAFGLSVLTSAAGLGAIIAGVTGKFDIGTEEDVLGPLLRVVYLLAAANFAFSFMPEIWSAACGAGVLGYLIAQTGIMAQTLINLRAEPAMRGRVLSYYNVVFRGAPAIGALLLGALSEVTGLSIAIQTSGVLLLIATGLFHWNIRRRAPSA